MPVVLNLEQAKPASLRARARTRIRHPVKTRLVVSFSKTPEP
jgi:hypothetical protein